jgi:hypothetical protein
MCTDEKKKFFLTFLKSLVMTKRQEDKLTMWTATNAVLNQYEAVWQGIKAFLNAATEFRKIRLEIDPEADMQQSNKTGITQDKAAWRKSVTEKCRQMALNIEAYAISNKNFSLQKQFEFTPTYFEKLRDNALPVVAHAIINKAIALKDALAEYGTTGENIKELSKAINRYENMSPAPKLASDRGKQATVNIAEKLEAGNTQLKLMDKLAGNFAGTHPEFVSAFRNARIVINLSSSKKPKQTSAKGTPGQATAA